MVPDHIDDLPRRDDDYRQLMLGLIDDLPQDRRGTRQLMMWAVACDLSSHPRSPVFTALRVALSVSPLSFTVTPVSFAVVGA